MRVSGEREVSTRLIVHVGAEGDARLAAYRGDVPAGDVNDPEAAVTSFDQTTRGTHGGAWAEAEAKLSRRVAATLGLRADAHSASGAALDPRANLFVALSEGTRLRFAAGLYSQAPDLATVALARGSADPGELASGADLGIQRATHLIAGITHERGPLTLRAEAYDKRYRDLVVQRSGTVYGNVGAGHARGLDLFARWGSVGGSPVSGWISYSLLDARRTLVQRDGLEARLASGRPGFGVAHSFNAVAKTGLWRGLSVSGRFRAALGRPVTPVVGAVRAPEGRLLLPHRRRARQRNAARLPAPRPRGELHASAWARRARSSSSARSTTRLTAPTPAASPTPPTTPRARPRPRRTAARCTSGATLLLSPR